MDIRRTVDWRQWGITFSTHVFVDVHKGYVPHEIYGTLHFPIGTQGPTDLNCREEYKKLCFNWIQEGSLPSHKMFEALKK